MFGGICWCLKISFSEDCNHHLLCGFLQSLSKSDLLFSTKIVIILESKLGPLTDKVFESSVLQMVTWVKYSPRCRSYSPLQSQIDTAHPSSSWCREVQGVAASRVWRGHLGDSRTCCRERRDDTEVKHWREHLFKTLNHFSRWISLLGPWNTLITGPNRHI